jgi:hypothetical protein
VKASILQPLAGGLISMQTSVGCAILTQGRKGAMNVVDYCKGMEMELTAWKAKMYDLTRKVESLGSKEKDKVLPNIQDLNILLSEMSSRIDQLKNECPTEWSPQKKDIEKGTVDMRGKYEQTLEYIGKHAPVSIPG